MYKGQVLMNAGASLYIGGKAETMADGVKLAAEPVSYTHLDVYKRQVQKFAKRLLNKYWGIYTELGDSFLENLQGLTTLKIYRSDEKKAAEMDEESQRFRRITMKVLTMQLNSTSVMDIIAYGGAAAGMIVKLDVYKRQVQRMFQVRKELYG